MPTAARLQRVKRALTPKGNGRISYLGYVDAETGDRVRPWWGPDGDLAGDPPAGAKRVVVKFTFRWRTCPIQTWPSVVDADLVDAGMLPRPEEQILDDGAPAPLPEIPAPVTSWYVVRLDAEAIGLFAAGQAWFWGSNGRAAYAQSVDDMIVPKVSDGPMPASALGLYKDRAEAEVVAREWLDEAHRRYLDEDR